MGVIFRKVIESTHAGLFCNIYSPWQGKFHKSLAKLEINAAIHCLQK
jgi:hypothetical protein